MRIMAFALALVAFSASAYAIVAPIEPAPPAAYACTPDNFKLEADGDGLRLTGSLDMPTPDYKYEFTDIETRPDNSIHATLKVAAPEGMVIQVISPMDIEQSFDLAAKLVIKVDGKYNDGAEEIICKEKGEKE